MIFKARYKLNSDTEYQTLSYHLEETGNYAELFAADINLSKPALLAGLLHDLGKNNPAWQQYLENSNKTGKKDQTIDHGAAGGQYIFENLLKNQNKGNNLIAQLLAACVMFHHGLGLPDILNPDGSTPLFKRLQKQENETHKNESVLNLDKCIKERIDKILNDENFIPETFNILWELSSSNFEKNESFYLGLTARFLSSCLIDADRRSSAFYEKGIPVKIEEAVAKVNWTVLRERLENHLDRFPRYGRLNEIRNELSNRCAEFGIRGDGIYYMTSATGTGKTLASLRYALVHAERTGKNRIFIIAPYTSILDQNAKIIRDILDPGGKNGNLILEHHSNLDQSEITEHSDELTETWNVPIIITTMVQFLDALFGAGTRKIRRMHQFANSVIVLDEAQTLPVSCTFLFNLAVQYLCKNAKVSFLISTATRPVLNKLTMEYALPYSAENEIVPNISKHFNELKRVNLINQIEGQSWTLDKTVEFIGQLEENNILIVVNTKAQASTLYKKLSDKHPDWEIVYLSANMCPVHRRKIIDSLRDVYLPNKSKKCICISTRLIEAGVDIDFDCAIRFLAGFDSIIQTAGRCNRNGKLKDSMGNPRTGNVYIIRIKDEEGTIRSLPELILGQRIMLRILREFNDNPSEYNNDIMHPQLIDHYFLYYFGEKQEPELKYEIDKGYNTVLDLLADNEQSRKIYYLDNKQDFRLNKKLNQAFKTAWEKFEVIAQDTTGVIVPFEKGKDIIAELDSQLPMQNCLKLLHEAQQYSVNVYSNQLGKLIKNKVIKKIKSPLNLDTYTADEKFYDINTGLSDFE